MDTPTRAANSRGASPDAFQLTSSYDLQNSLDVFNKNAKNTSTDCHHIREAIHEMDFAIVKIKDERFKSLCDMTYMWPFGADGTWDGSGFTKPKLRDDDSDQGIVIKDKVS